MFIRFGFQLVLTFIGILLIVSLPYLFFNIDRQLAVLLSIDKGLIKNTWFLYDSIEVNWLRYFDHINVLIHQFFTFSNPQYYDHGEYVPLFPELWNLYGRSLFMLITALFLGLGISIVCTFLIMKLGSLGRRLSQMGLFIFESLPDIFIILLLQYGVIFIFKKTGILLFNIADFYNNSAAVLPVLCLSVLPTVFLTKYLLLFFQNEEKELYVDLALGKGLSRNYVLLVHILRNALISLFNHFKTIFWLTLSNLFVLEILFNIKGVMKFITTFSPMTPDITVYVLLFFFIPYVLFFIVFEFSLKQLGLRGGSDRV
ncbi:hypothetical protein AWM68_01915 [Fictibacillus phosphorivorans]|uniref:ABC transmembrane type-1 domain-containing protein n=2 Tax=Fictibacillus phosphorivorans TaxID=1221500 RepID=A0A163SGS0_9BACL|nr:hypothetical protein AWM68_01915 [Fictibacillus phosphorivorans]